MRYNEIIKEDTLQESFYWQTSKDEEVAKQLNSLIKYNDGFFKSAKQANFLSGTRSPLRSLELQKENLFKYGITPPSDMVFAVRATGMAVWAEGRRGRRPVEWVYIIDNLGVKEKYKLSFTFDPSGRTAISVNPEKTVIEFERQNNEKADQLKSEIEGKDIEDKEKIQQKLATATHVGQIGQRQDFNLTVKKIIYRGMGQYGDIYLTISEDKDGNTFFYNGLFKLPNEEIKEGINITVKATVKDHINSKTGEPVTVISRPKVLKVS